MGGRGGGGKEKGKGDHWNTPERYGRDLVNFILPTGSEGVQECVHALED